MPTHTPVRRGVIKRGQFIRSQAEQRLRVEYAELSLVGGRDDNQDRVAIAATADAVLLVVADGMGGHSDGALAAETAVKLIVTSFELQSHPLLDPVGFLHLTLGRAHQQVVALGLHLAVELRPRATIAVCIVQGDSAWWAHIGDSRIYLLRQGKVTERTRDHSHVEFLIRERVISAEQAQAHPMRNFVECCLGGEALLPEMTIGGLRRLQPKDTLLLCSDGFWGGLDEADIATSISRGPADAFPDTLGVLAARAVAANGSTSDNTSVAALRWLSA